MEDGESLLAFPQAPDAIEIRHLRAFVAVAEELNFGRAAARLHLSQPALSRQVRALERLVGVELLRRSTHRVELTLAGEALLDRARRLIGDLEEAVAATQSVGGELARRVAQLYQPLADLAAAQADLHQVRDAYEALHAEFSPPPEIGVRPVNADGVAGLLLAAELDRPPTIHYLHGGGYILGSAFGYRPLAGALAAAAETGAFVPEYRLAPEHPFPAALEDALRSYLWLIEQTGAPELVTLAGDSAGGGLALSLLLTLRDRGLPLPGAVVLLCPGVDLSFEHVRLGNDAPELDAVLEIGRKTVEAYLAGHPLEDPIVSPLRADLSGLPPMLIQAATGDHFRPEQQALAERARDHGVDVRLELYPVAVHVFHYFWTFLPEAADALQSAGAFARDQRVRAAA
jgi:acetyl esterase/lipase/DNA-binding transcriptional ArsR family regulator